MAVTQTNIDELNEAIAQPERVIDMDDRKVVYRDVSELVRAKAIIQSELDASNGKNRSCMKFCTILSASNL